MAMSATSPYAAERRAAVEAVLTASKLCRSLQQRLSSSNVLTKGDESPVTIADFSSQAVISHMLAVEFPDIPLMGEEDATDLRSAKNDAQRQSVCDAVRSVLPELGTEEFLRAIDRGNHTGGKRGLFWALDPIDGTKGFVRQEQFAVALALIEDGAVVMGLLGCPNLPVDYRCQGGRKGCLFVAVKGQGCILRELDSATEQLISVSSISEPADACFCESFEGGHSSHELSAQIAMLLQISQPPYRIDSQCKYGAVAYGGPSIYLRLPPMDRPERHECLWDHAAGYCVVTEAGGRVTDMHGKLLDFSQGAGLSANVGVVVTNGKIHDKVLAAIAAATEESSHKQKRQKLGECEDANAEGSSIASSL